jgi:hypothetical protein
MAGEKTPLVPNAPQVPGSSSLPITSPPTQLVIGTQPVAPEKSEIDSSCCCQVACSCPLGSAGLIAGATATKCLGATSAAACGWGTLAAAILCTAGCFFGITVRDKQNLKKYEIYEKEHAKWLDREGDARAEANRDQFSLNK